MKSILLKSLFVLTLAGGMISCTSNTEKASTETAEQGKEYTSAYICPMHCEGSGSDSMGTCPVCEMDYRENPSTK